MDREQAVRHLLKEHAKLSAYLWVLLPELQAAEDILQDVAVLLLSKHHQILNEAHLSGWLRTTCRLKALERLRAEKRQPQCFSPGLLDLIDAEWTHSESMPQGNMEMLQKCLEKLSPRARELVQLRYFEGLKSGAIAERLSRKVETVYNSLLRIHNRLADCIALSARQANREANHG